METTTTATTTTPVAGSAAVPLPTICQLLRQATAQAHCRLENRVESGGFFDTRGRYTLLLQRFYGYYAAVEPAVAQYADDLTSLGIDTTARRHLPWIVADLTALGWPEASVLQLPVCADAPTLPTLDETLGFLYVVEGSTLGGALISRRVQESLGLGAETPQNASGGCAFFASYGPRVGRMWRDFCIAMQRYSETRERRCDERIIAGARETFVTLERWIAGVG